MRVQVGAALAKAAAAAAQFAQDNVDNGLRISVIHEKKMASQAADLPDLPGFVSMPVLVVWSVFHLLSCLVCFPSSFSRTFFVCVSVRLCLSVFVFFTLAMLEKAYGSETLSRASSSKFPNHY